MSNIPKLNQRLGDEKLVPMTIMVSERSKVRLKELKTFHGINTSEWVRQLIEIALDDYDKRQEK